MSKRPKWLPFEEARKWAVNSSIRSFEGWRRAGRKAIPEGISTSPDEAYRAEWRGWKHFLGTERVSFEEARKYARRLGLTSREDWLRQELPKGMTNYPERIYDDEWKGWEDFLGFSREDVRSGAYVSFEEAREAVGRYGKVGMRSRDDWRRMVEYGVLEFLEMVPKCPEELYEEEWQGWVKVPRCPEEFYEKEWRGWAHWFGFEGLRRLPGYDLRDWLRDYVRAAPLGLAEQCWLEVLASALTTEKDRPGKPAPILVDAGGSDLEKGAALWKERRGKLYRRTHSTFEAFCKDRLGMDRAQAYRLMDASVVMEGIERYSTSGELPVNERQLRALGCLKDDPEAAAKAWDRAVLASREAGRRRATGAFVARAAKAIVG